MNKPDCALTVIDMNTLDRLLGDRAPHRACHNLYEDVVK
jgi:hypothetical protein